MFSQKDIQTETERLYEKLSAIKWKQEDCAKIAPLTLEINTLKKEKEAIILAHAYQTPDIMYGVADFVGDSFGLSMTAKNTDAKIIVFCSVHFMAETAKILNPTKEVLVPKISGCSLAESITAKDVKELKKKYPNIPVVTYVNTTAEVKAESDICVTSSNVLSIIQKLPSQTLIFIPDRYMAKNIAQMTSKEIISWNGKCIVHEKIDIDHINKVRKKFPKAHVLAHTECPPEVIKTVDMAGGTNDMKNYVSQSSAKEFMLATECGLAERFRIEFKDKKFIGSCQICPYMKEITLKDILKTLKDPAQNQRIEIDAKILQTAKQSLEKMIAFS